MDPAPPSSTPRPDSNRLSIPVPPPADSPQRSQTPSSVLGLSPSKPSALPIGRLSRANSLVSSRPAPQSPASSRPPSQIFSPQLQGRARAGSGASSTTLGPTSTLGRRTSASGPSSSDPSRRASVSASRRKSALSNSVSAAVSAPVSATPSASASAVGSGSASDEPPTPLGESLATTPIPELADDQLSAQLQPPVQVVTRQPGEVIVRDYAYAPSDDRHRGVFPPVPDKRESRSSFNMGRWKFPFAPSPNPDTGGGGGAGDRRSGSGGWGGFGLLGWRGLSGRRPSQSSPNASSSGLASGSGSGAALNQIQTPDLGNDEDDYAFSSTASSSQDLARGGLSDDDDDDDEEQEEEPYGTYRAMYQFVAEGQHEIDLEEGDVIHVRGWGVGEGWVVAVKMEDGRQRTGLVPEGFIERVDTPVEGDSGEDRGEEGHEHEGERTSTPTEMCSPGFKAEQVERDVDRSMSPAQV